MKRKLNERDAPEPVKDKSGPSNEQKPNGFASLNLEPRLLQAVTREKFAVPTPVQAKAIPLSLAGKDVLIRSKTGSGKTLAYTLPILDAVLRRKTGSGRIKQTTVLILVPTKELATQVTVTLKTFASFCAQVVRFENVSQKEEESVTRARLAEAPDVVVATPAQAVRWINESVLDTAHLKHLVIDEADLVFSYGYEDDLRALAAALPITMQKIMTSATLRTEVDTLMSMFFTSERKPENVDMSTEEAAEKPKLSQYITRTAEDDKFLLLYAIFKLQLIKGKVIVFVADVDRCYRVKLFLEQFGIRSCILNSELPVNSRLHVVEEFNKGVYDIIIAADESEVVGVEGGRSKRRKVQREEQAEKSQGDAPGGKDDAQGGSKAGGESVETSAQTAHDQKSGRRKRRDKEFGVSRGIDFRNVSCVLNFDLPTTLKSYIHRIGRTARAGQTGMALSFYVPRELYRKHKPTSIPQSEEDETVVRQIKEAQAESGTEVQEWQFDMAKLEGFRYRFNDALRSVTRIAVREARTKELRNALINSEKLKRHFEENPEDLHHLRHDTETHAVRRQEHLRHIPDYLLPAGGKQAVTQDVGFVGLRSGTENGLRKRRAFNKSRGKGRIMKGKANDPLKSLNLKGRGKK